MQKSGLFEKYHLYKLQKHIPVLQMFLFCMDKVKVNYSRLCNGEEKFHKYFVY